MIKIGVLALQGAVREHIRHIELSGYEGIAIKRVEQLDEIDGLILPCLLYTSPSPRDGLLSRMPSSA